MAIVKIILDTRYKNEKKEAPIKFSVSNNRNTTYIATNFFVKEIEFVGNERNDKFVKSTVYRAKEINEELSQRLLEYRNKIAELGTKATGLSAKELKDILLSNDGNNGAETFFTYAYKQLERYSGNSKLSMQQTLKLLEIFFGNRLITFEGITTGTLRSIDEKWEQDGRSINTRGIHFRNMRTIFNRAIDDELTTNYPFRKFKIKSVVKTKELLPIESIKQLASMEFGKSEELKEKARDVFMLSFYLCGANLKDIYNWTQENYKNGKIVFVREKIKRFEPESVRITLQSEAKELLEKYKGTNHLFSFADDYSNYDTFRNNIEKRIREFRDVINFSELTMYYARYSWATIADKIGIDEKVIDKSIGHVPTTVAGKFYITYDWDRTDQANRKVIDYVLSTVI